MWAGVGHNGGCGRAGWVYNGHIMVALIETASELGPRRAARGCRVVAGGHQTGNGIAAGEVNYPGAAAQFRCLGTGFRAADATNGFSSSPSVPNTNGADTYPFVGNDPAGKVEPGRFWCTTVLGPDGPIWKSGVGCQIYVQLHAPSSYDEIFRAPAPYTTNNFHAVTGVAGLNRCTCRPGFPGLGVGSAGRAILESNLINAMVGVGLGQHAHDVAFLPIDEGFFGISGGAAVEGAGNVHGVHTIGGGLGR